MRKERFLISVLWISAMALLASWFFNVSFGFDVFARAHWRYLSELQVSGGVDRWFYTAIAAFAVAGIVGLYLLIVPWHRKISVRVEPSVRTHTAVPDKDHGAAHESKAPEPLPARPPKLNLNNVFIPTRREQVEMPPDAAPSPVPSEKIGVIQDMLARAGFVPKDPPSVGGVRLDFWSVGSDEALVAGLFAGESGEITAAEGGDSVWRSGARGFKSPVWVLTGVVQKLQALFMEVIDAELKINILPFVFVDGAITNRGSVQAIWDALGIKVFDNADAFADFIARHKPRELGDGEKDDFAAFSDFIDTVSGHFNSGGA
jgi:hypothetical protein